MVVRSTVFPSSLSACALPYFVQERVVFIPPPSPSHLHSVHTVLVPHDPAAEEARIRFMNRRVKRGVRFMDVEEEEEVKEEKEVNEEEETTTRRMKDEFPEQPQFDYRDVIGLVGSRTAEGSGCVWQV